MNAYLKLQKWWARTDAGIITQPVAEHQLSDLEKRYDIRLPEDFREYLKLSSPVGEAMDNEVTTWWDFDRIKNIPEEYPHELAPFIHAQREKYLFFADYSIWCWAWAISCADDANRGRVALIAGRTYDKFVADSFSDFVSRYTKDLRSVF